MKNFRDLTILALVTILTTIILWAPFFLRLEKILGIPIPPDGMATVVANYDGPNYIVAAKTLYDPELIKTQFNFPLDPIYYSAHYPLFPLLIRGTAEAFPFLGYPYAMILVTLITSVVAVWMFYLLLAEFGLKKYALWLSLVFAVLPARWLIVRSIGSPEPLFLATIMASIYFFNRGQWWLSGIAGAAAQLTKPPAILLFVAYGLTLLIVQWPKIAHTDFVNWVKKLEWRAYPLLLIPLTLLGIYAFYGWRYNDFFAYFNSGDNIHLQFPPFQVFNPSQPWVGTFWLEEVIWLYVFGGLGFFYLFKQGYTLLASFVGIFFLSILFVAHRDLSRYMLPIVPFLFIAFSKLLVSNEFKYVMVIILIPIYLYAIAFITNNVTPIGDWSPLL